MRYYFKLQLKLSIRALKNNYENPWFLIIILFVAFIVSSAAFLNNVPNAPYFYLLLETGVILSLSSKKRNQFLSSIFLKKKYIVLRIIENILVALPFILSLVYKKLYWLSLINLILCLLLSFYNIPGLKSYSAIPSPFSKRPYEFTTGFRRTYWLIIITYCLAIYSITQHDLILSMASLLGVFIICVTFYSHLDPIFYVWIHAQSAKVFLGKKITTAIIYSLLLSLPVIVLFVIFYPNNLPTIFLILTTGILYIVLSVVYVYVNFPVKTTQSQNLQYIAGLLFPPLTILIIPNFYSQAVRRLKDYLLC